MKSKGKIIISICTIALTLFLITVLDIGDNYENTAVKYAEAYHNFDYKGIKDSLPYDVDEMFYDMFNEYCRENYLSVSDGLSWWADEFYTELDSVDGMLEKCCSALLSDVAEDYKVDVTVIDSRELHDYEIDDAIKSNTLKYDEWGVDLSNYIDVEKIKSAYEVELEINIREYDDTYTNTMNYVVVKYSGDWKVLTIFDPDMY